MRRITFSTERLGTASVLCDRAMSLGLSVDRTRSSTGGFIVCAVGEADEDAATELIQDLEATIEANEDEG